MLREWSLLFERNEFELGIKKLFTDSSQGDRSEEMSAMPENCFKIRRSIQVNLGEGLGVQTPENSGKLIRMSFMRSVAAKQTRCCVRIAASGLPSQEGLNNLRN